MVQRVTQIRDDAEVIEYICDACKKGSMREVRGKASAAGFMHKCQLCDEEQILTSIYPFIKQHSEI